MPKAWKILFLNPGLLGLASCWCWPLLAADCPSCSALCTNGSELFTCVRLRSYACECGRRWDSARIRSDQVVPDVTNDETKKRTKRKKKRIVDGYKCLCQLLHSMRKCIRLIYTSKWQTTERKLTSSWLCSCSLLARLDREPRLVELLSSPNSVCTTRALLTSSNACKEKNKNKLFYTNAYYCN